MRSELNHPRIIVTEGARGHARSTLAGVRALARGGYRPVVAMSGERSMAASSRSCAGRAAVPAPDDPAFAASIAVAASECGAVGVLPASDAALLALGAPVGDLVDKARLAVRAAAVGFATPPTERVRDVATLLERASELPYPLVVKPLISRFPASRLDGPGDIDGLPFDGPMALQPFLDGPMEAVAGVIRDGRLVAVVHQRYRRTWPVQCGTSCAAVSVAGDPLREERLPGLLAGYEGVFQVQFLDAQLIDVNPRLYGSLPLAVRSGVNLAALHADLLAGRPSLPTLQRGRPGVSYRWIDGDLRHLMALLRSGRKLRTVLAALAPRLGTAHSIWSLRDPLPMLVRMRRGLGR